MWIQVALSYEFRWVKSVKFMKIHRCRLLIMDRDYPVSSSHCLDHKMNEIISLLNYLPTSVTFTGDFSVIIPGRFSETWTSVHPGSGHIRHGHTRTRTLQYWYEQKALKTVLQLCQYRVGIKREYFCHVGL